MEQIKCGQVNCDKPAVCRYVWSDNFVYGCKECAEKAIKISNFMGFNTPANTMELLPNQVINFKDTECEVK